MMLSFSDIEVIRSSSGTMLNIPLGRRQLIQCNFSENLGDEASSHVAFAESVIENYQSKSETERFYVMSSKVLTEDSSFTFLSQYVLANFNNPIDPESSNSFNNLLVLSSYFRDMKLNCATNSILSAKSVSKIVNSFITNLKHTRPIDLFGLKSKTVLSHQAEDQTFAVTQFYQNKLYDKNQIRYLSTTHSLSPKSRTIIVGKDWYVDEITNLLAEVISAKYSLIRNNVLLYHLTLDRTKSIKYKKEKNKYVYTLKGIIYDQEVNQKLSFDSPIKSSQVFFDREIMISKNRMPLTKNDLFYIPDLKRTTAVKAHNKFFNHDNNLTIESEIYRLKYKHIYNLDADSNSPPKIESSVFGALIDTKEQYSENLQ